MLSVCSCRQRLLHHLPISNPMLVINGGSCKQAGLQKHSIFACITSQHTIASSLIARMLSKIQDCCSTYNDSRILACPDLFQCLSISTHNFRGEPCLQLPAVDSDGALAPPEFGFATNGAPSSGTGKPSLTWGAMRLVGAGFWLTEQQVSQIASTMLNVLEGLVDQSCACAESPSTGAVFC